MPEPSAAASAALIWELVGLKCGWHGCCGRGVSGIWMEIEGGWRG